MDYRQIHLEKGESYDDNLRRDPFDAFMADREDALLATIIPKLFPQSIPRYLDFACGTGRVLRSMERFATQAVGVDISASMLEQAKQHCEKAQFQCLDVTKDDHDLKDFDLATSFRFFGNADDSLRRAVLTELAKAVKPGGYLVVNNHRNPGALMVRLARASGAPAGVDLTHAKFDGLLREAGFEPVQVHGIGLCVLSGRFARASLLTNPLFNAVDRISELSPLAPLCPDAIIVARRMA